MLQEKSYIETKLDEEFNEENFCECPHCYINLASIQEKEDSYIAARSYMNAGRLFKKNKEYKEAIQTFSKAVPLLKDTYPILLLKLYKKMAKTYSIYNKKNKILVGIYYENIADTYYDITFYDKASKYYLKSHNIYTKSSNNLLKSLNILPKLSDVYIQLKDYTKAYKSYSDAIELSLKVPSKDLKVRLVELFCLMNLCKLLTQNTLNTPNETLIETNSCIIKIDKSTEYRNMLKVNQSIVTQSKLLFSEAIECFSSNDLYMSLLFDIRLKYFSL
jgi:tetratricopeptide (TPR) repeat protein